MFQYYSLFVENDKIQDFLKKPSCIILHPPAIISVQI